MTQSGRFIIKIISAVIFLVNATLPLIGQNLYDADHSRKYADFLFQSQQYRLAAMEYERLNFMDPGKKTFRENLIVSYRKSEQYQRGLIRIRDWYGDSLPEAGLFRELIKLNFLESNYLEIAGLLDNLPPIADKEKDYYLLASSLLQKDWSEAKNIIVKDPDATFPGFSELCALAREQNEIKYSKPGVALTLSAVIPGLGKVYSHDWKDGIISFLFVATNAFQAYRGFSKDGVKSAYGWIFGTLGLGFYAGNLYGSWKSAKDYNYRVEDKLYHEIENTVYSRF
jgi:hypothetical protein